MSRRVAGQGSIVREGDRFRGAIQIQGKRHYRRGKTKREVEQKLAAISAGGRVAERWLSCYSVSDLLSLWLAVCEERVNARTLARDVYETYCLSVSQHLTPILGPVAVDRLRPKHVGRLHELMAGSSQNRWEITMAHGALNAALQFAIETGRIVTSPIWYVASPE